MKKLSIIIILILAAIFIIMPTIVGRVAEQATYKLLDRLNAKSGKYGKLILVDYQRGFRETNFNFSWNENDKNIYLNETLAINCIGIHGVISYSHQCTVRSIDFVTQSGAAQEKGTQSLISLTGNFSLFGKANEMIKINKFELHQSNNISIYFLPTMINVVSDDGLTNFDINAKAEGFKLFTQNKKLVVTNFNLEGRGALNALNFIIGNVSASSDYVSIESATNELVSNEKFIFEGLTMDTTTEVDGQDISLEHKLMANNYAFVSSEAIDLKNLDFEFKLSGVDMAQLALLNEKIESISNNAKFQTNASYIRLIPVFQDLLKTNLSAIAMVSANDLTDQITVNANVKLVGGLSFGDVLMLKLNPKSVFSKVVLNYDSTIPQSVLNKNLTQLNTIDNNTWYTKTEEGYISNFNMQDGVAILNDKQLSMEEMLAMIGR